jgi:hypothetical protein
MEINLYPPAEEGSPDYQGPAISPARISGYFDW